MGSKATLQEKENAHRKHPDTQDREDDHQDVHSFVFATPIKKFVKHDKPPCR